MPHSRGRKEEEEEGEEEDDQAGRAEASTVSFITNLFHPVVEMGHCSLRASKATSMSSTSRNEREIPLSNNRCLYSVFGSTRRVRARAHDR